MSTCEKRLDCGCVDTAFAVPQRVALDRRIHRHGVGVPVVDAQSDRVDSDDDPAPVDRNLFDWLEPIERRAGESHCDDRGEEHSHGVSLVASLPIWTRTWSPSWNGTRNALAAPLGVPKRSFTP